MSCFFFHKLHVIYKGAVYKYHYCTWYQCCYLSCNRGGYVKSLGEVVPRLIKGNIVYSELEQWNCYKEELHYDRSL